MAHKMKKILLRNRGGGGGVQYFLVEESWSRWKRTTIFSGGETGGAENFEFQKVAMGNFTPFPMAVGHFYVSTSCHFYVTSVRVTSM